MRNLSKDLKSDSKAVRSLEKHYMQRKRRRKTYIAHEERDFYWDYDEVKEIEKMWKDGVSILEMAERFDRSPLETFLLILDRAETGRILEREGSIFGNEN